MWGSQPTRQTGMQSPHCKYFEIGFQLSLALKGQCHKIFCFRFFHESSSPELLKITLGFLPNLPAAAHLPVPLSTKLSTSTVTKPVTLPSPRLCKIFGLHPKVMLPQHVYSCNFVAIALVCPTKVSIMKLTFFELGIIV